jgi:hypothetical protein
VAGIAPTRCIGRSFAMGVRVEVGAVKIAFPNRLLVREDRPEKRPTG